MVAHFLDRGQLNGLRGSLSQESSTLGESLPVTCGSGIFEESEIESTVILCFCAALGSIQRDSSFCIYILNPYREIFRAGERQGTECENQRGETVELPKKEGRARSTLIGRVADPDKNVSILIGRSTRSDLLYIHVAPEYASDQETCSGNSGCSRA